jgi:hypothetical protein
MATYEDVPIIPVNSKQRSREMGWNVYDGKRAINGVYFYGKTQDTFMVSKWIHVGTTGNLVFEQIDGEVGVVLNAEVGWHPVSARRILVSGTPNDGGASVTTTATNVTYHGGT